MLFLHWPVGLSKGYRAACLPAADVATLTAACDPTDKVGMARPGDPTASCEARIADWRLSRACAWRTMPGETTTPRFQDPAARTWAWNRRMNRDRIKIDWKFHRRSARRNPDTNATLLSGHRPREGRAPTSAGFTAPTGQKPETTLCQSGLAGLMSLAWAHSASLAWQLLSYFAHGIRDASSSRHRVR